MDPSPLDVVNGRLEEIRHQPTLQVNTVYVLLPGPSLTMFCETMCGKLFCVFFLFSLSCVCCFLSRTRKEEDKRKGVQLHGNYFVARFEF